MARLKSKNLSKKTAKRNNSATQKNSNPNGKNGRNKPYRQNRKSSSNENFTADEIVAWAEHHGGIPPEDTQKSLDISERTYYRYIKNIDQAVKCSIQIEDLQNIMLMLFSLALKSVIENLKAYHPGMTLGYLKGMGILKEHIKGEGFASHQYNYFGDSVVNEIVDKIRKGTRPPDAGSRTRFEKPVLADSKNPLSR